VHLDLTGAPQPDLRHVEAAVDLQLVQPSRGTRAPTAGGAGRVARAPGRLEGLDRRRPAEQEAELVDAFQQAVLGERVERKARLGAVAPARTWRSKSISIAPLPAARSRAWLSASIIAGNRPFLTRLADSKRSHGSVCED
jgi:hypothetical protein